MEWISVKDRLPEVEQRILFYSESIGVRMGMRMMTIANNPRKPKPVKFQVYGGLMFRTDVTHWMKLPAAPESPSSPPKTEEPNVKR